MRNLVYTTRIIPSIDHMCSVDLCREYGTYLGEICDVKPAICVIIFRRINQYIYKPDWFICVSVWTGIILLRNMDLSGGVIGISV